MLMKELVLILALGALAGCASKSGEYKTAPAPAAQQSAKASPQFYLTRLGVDLEGPFKTKAACEAALAKRSLGASCEARAK